MISAPGIEYWYFLQCNILGSRKQCILKIYFFRGVRSDKVLPSETLGFCIYIKRPELEDHNTSSSAEF
jgi:hypothetical protein